MFTGMFIFTLHVLRDVFAGVREGTGAERVRLRLKLFQVGEISKAFTAGVNVC